MRIVLATGIYPPDIGGPATYVEAVAHQMRVLGHDVKVVTYGDADNAEASVLHVPKSGGVLVRWMRYAKALRAVGADADRVYAFSSVSVGIPLMLSGLSKPKKILRLGGDFFWERYTDAGGMKSLREWYASRFGVWRTLNTAFMEAILRSFDHIVYSTEFQRDIHRTAYGSLNATVIHNVSPDGMATSHASHTPFRLLFMGRFVRFKNIPALIQAMKRLSDATLTIVGSGAIEGELRALVDDDLLQRVKFFPSADSDAKQKIFHDHDALILPSVTEISPNTALEAVAHGLPVLLSEETGLQKTSGIHTAPLRTSDDIVQAVHAFMRMYGDHLPCQDVSPRSYDEVAQDLLAIA